MREETFACQQMAVLNAEYEEEKEIAIQFGAEASRDAFDHCKAAQVEDSKNTEELARQSLEQENK